MHSIDGSSMERFRMSSTSPRGIIIPKGRTKWQISVPNGPKCLPITLLY
jgi:hypothetical protein